MARPKAAFLKDLAKQAQSDLEILDNQKIVMKLRVIIAIAKHPIETVAEIMGVTAQSICRWVLAYKESGVEGLVPKAKKPKPSKLSEEQKAETLSWIATGKTAKGEYIHWTLEGLRLAIAERFGITLGINTIWVWLKKEGWKPKVPRPRHYEADKDAQEAFKKTQYPGNRES